MTATSSRLALALVAALALAGAATLAGCGSVATPAAGQAQAFSWLHPSPTSRGWRVSPLPDSPARLGYPSSWRAIRSDPGTVSAAIRTSGGGIEGYLNATPQQGDETLSDWGTFRVDHNRKEGDVDVRQLASAGNLSFRRAHGSCVIDAYTSSSGHRYREIACIVAGATATTVVVGAAPPAHWQQEAPVLERSISALAT